MKACPCYSGQPYARCCQPFHTGEQVPASAEQLMRARYSAYALKLADFLNHTWHPDTLESPLTQPSLQGTKWLGLTIHETTQSDATHATVTFTAKYKQGKEKTAQMTEKSRFTYENQQWFYLDGEHQ